MLPRAVVFGLITGPYMQTLLNETFDGVRPLIGKGKAADYIPTLADVPANQLDIAVVAP